MQQEEGRRTDDGGGEVSSALSGAQLSSRDTSPAFSRRTQNMRSEKEWDFYGQPVAAAFPLSNNMNFGKAEGFAVAEDDEEATSELLNQHVELVDSLPTDRPWPPFSEVKRKTRRKRVTTYLAGLAIAALVVVFLAVVAMSLSSSDQQVVDGSEPSPSDLGLGSGGEGRRRTLENFLRGPLSVHNDRE